MIPRLACRNERGFIAPRLLGVLLLAAGLLLNRWTLGQMLAPDGQINGEWRNAQIAGVQILLVLSGVVLVLPGLRNWSAASRWRLGAAALAVPTLSGLLALAGFGTYIYLTQHQHTINSSNLGAATPAHLQWADDIRRRGWEVALRNGWFDFDKAKRDGFEPQWGDREHFVNRANVFDDEVLNIEKPEFLMYLDTPRGKLLAGYMFFTRRLEDHGPTPFGPLGAWHFHPWPGRGYCAVEGILPVARPDNSGHCAEGERVDRSAEMFHVYLIDHPLGAFTDAMVFPSAHDRFNIAWVHPILVHFTIALFLLAVALDLIAYVTRHKGLHEVAFVNLAVAAVVTLATMAAGMAAEMHVLVSEADHELLHRHKRFAFAVVACILVLGIWRSLLRGRFPSRAAPLYMLLALTGAGLTVTAAYWGGELVYKLGVSVRAIDDFALDSYQRKVDSALGRPPTLPRKTADDD